MKAALKRFTGFLAGRSAPAVLSGCVLVVVAITVADYFTLQTSNSALLCLIPVLIATWYVGERYGLALALLSAVSFFLTDQLWAREADYSVPLMLWNTLVPLLFFIVSVQMLSMLKSSLAREAVLSRTDPLTGLCNRRRFNELCACAIENARRYRHPLSLAYMDMDNFKCVNDEYGHDTGDELLRSAGELFRRNVRAVDTVARLGGDEFAVLLPETPPRSGALAMVKLQRLFLGLMEERGWPVTLSIGLVTYLEPPGSAQEMLMAADTLMYEVKSSGKNNIDQQVVGGTADSG